MPCYNIRFSNFSTLEPLFVLEVEQNTTVRALKAMTEERLLKSSDSDMFPKYFDKWHLQVRVGDRTKQISIDENDEELTLVAAGFEDECVVHLEGPVFTEGQAEVGRAIATVRESTKRDAHRVQEQMANLSRRFDEMSTQKKKLMEGQQASHKLILKLLGGDIEKKNEEGLTALQVAASSLDPDRVRALINLGANLNAKDNQGRTIVHLAMKAPDTSLVQQPSCRYGDPIRQRQRVLREDDTNTPPKDQHPILETIKAIIESQTQEDVRRFLSATDKDGNTPMHIAAINGCPELVKYLATAATNTINQANASGATPVQLAADTETLKALLDSDTALRQVNV